MLQIRQTQILFDAMITKQLFEDNIDCCFLADFRPKTKLSKVYC